MVGVEAGDDVGEDGYDCAHDDVSDDDGDYCVVGVHGEYDGVDEVMVSLEIAIQVVVTMVMLLVILLVLLQVMVLLVVVLLGPYLWRLVLVLGSM